MRDLFYLELRSCLKEVAAEKEIKIDVFLDEIEELINLSYIGRKEGLLALEEVVYNMGEDRKYLKRMISLIVDGTSPELVEEISWTRYIANDFHGYDGVIYLMQLVGVLSIQAGDNPRVIEEKILAMIPEEAQDVYINELQKKAFYETPEEEIDMSAVEELCTAKRPIKPGEEGYYEAKVLEYVLTCFDDRNIQRVLREVDNADLELAMRGISGESRHRIFNNLSKRLAVMIAEDVENISGVPRKYVRDAIHKILWIFNRLLDCYEIFCEDSEKIQTIFKVLKLDEPV